MYESNFTANAELDNILSLYLFKDLIKGCLLIFCLTNIIIPGIML